MKHALTKVVVGIDIAKANFDVAYLVETAQTDPQTRRMPRHPPRHLPRRLPNTPKGHRKLLKALSSFDEVHVIMEATGSYHVALTQALAQAALPYSIVNPLQIKRYGQMLLRRGKTDRADAQLIARYGQERQPEVSTPPPPQQQHLRELSTMIAQLVKQRTALKNLAHARAQLPQPSRLAQRVLQQQLRQLDRSIERLEAERERLIAEAYAEERALIKSVKGIGPKTSALLIGYVADMSQFENYRQLSAYMGMNPTPRESGERRGPSSISKRGHAALRTAFYMCAQSARRHNPSCRAMYERLRRRGKEKKVALIAVANKLVKQVFAVVKSGVPYSGDYHLQHA